MKPTVDQLIERDLLELAWDCARGAGVTLDEMFSRSRLKPRVEARRAFYQTLADVHGWSSVAIGRFVGRNHETVLSALGALSRNRERVGASLMKTALAGAFAPKRSA